MKVTYMERHFIDKYSCNDYERVRNFTSFFQPSGTSLIYFRNGEYEIFTLSKDEIISIE